MRAVKLGGCGFSIEDIYSKRARLYVKMPPHISRSLPPGHVQTRVAILGPTPGSDINSSNVRGMSPAYSVCVYFEGRNMMTTKNIGAAPSFSLEQLKCQRSPPSLLSHTFKILHTLMIFAALAV